METFAEGLATRTAFELPQKILWQWLDHFVLVSDDEIRAAQALMIEATRKLVEAAGAASFAAALRLREELRGKRVALILSGGNAGREQLLEALGHTQATRTEGPREDPLGELVGELRRWGRTMVRRGRWFESVGGLFCRIPHGHQPDGHVVAADLGWPSPVLPWPARRRRRRRA